MVVVEKVYVLKFEAHWIHIIVNNLNLTLTLTLILSNIKLEQAQAVFLFLQLGVLELSAAPIVNFFGDTWWLRYHIVA